MSVPSYMFLDFAYRMGKKGSDTLPEELSRALCSSFENHGGLMDPDDPTYRHQTGLNAGEQDRFRGDLGIQAITVLESFLYFRNVQNVENNSEYHPALFVNELIAVVGGMFTPETYNLRTAMLEKGIPEIAVDRVELSIQNVHEKMRSRRTCTTAAIEQMHEFVGREMVNELQNVFVNPQKIVSEFSKEIWRCFDSYRGIVDRFLYSLPGISMDTRQSILLKILQYAITHPVFLTMDQEVQNLERCLKDKNPESCCAKQQALNRLLRIGDAVEAMRTAKVFVMRNDSKFASFYQDFLAKFTGLNPEELDVELAA